MIFDHATKAEHLLQTAPMPFEGLTASELESIGGQAGIRPEQIRWALSEFELMRSGSLARVLLGEPAQCSSVQTFDVRLSDEAAERTLSRLRSFHSGFAIDLLPDDGRTTVRITDRLYRYAGGLFGGLVGGLGLGVGLGVGIGVGIGVLGSPLFAAGVPLGCVAAGYALARSLYGRIFRQRRGRLLGFAEKVRSILEATQEEAR